MFIKWNPNRTGPSEVFTLPEVDEAQEKVQEIADELLTEKDSWLNYDESVRAAFA